MSRLSTLLVAVAVAVALIDSSRARAQLPPHGLFSRTNLVAWCIVPFDTRKRGPEERAAMLDRLGIRRLAYDWRAEHVPTFDAEVEALRQHGIELTAWWFPATLDANARAILDCLKRHRLSPQLWVTLGTEPEPDPARLAVKIDEAAKTLAPVCEAAARLGSIVGLYNHLGWFGEPTNQLAIIERLRAAGHPNVGIVYNFHHGHEHIDLFPEILRRIRRHLIAINLNGMIWQGDRLGKKIIPLGTGDEELRMLQALQGSGWQGPVGILGHTEEDAEIKLRQELLGLESLVPKLDQPTRPAAPRPAAVTTPSAPVSPLPPPDAPFVPGRTAQSLDARVRALLTAGQPAFRQSPLLVEAWVRLASHRSYNLIAASENKLSPTHWELFTVAGTGELAVFLPGAQPSEIRGGPNLADGEWHHVAAFLGSDQVQLFLDGRPIATQAVERRAEPTPQPAQFAIGRLVEGGLGCEGLIESVRLSRGPRRGPAFGREPLAADAETIALWTFSRPSDFDEWSALAATVPAMAPVHPGKPAAKPAPASVNRDEPWKQTEGDWVDDRWNQTVPGRWQAYYLPTPSGTLRKGLAIRVGDRGQASMAYETATAQLRHAWVGGFLEFDPARFGLLNAPRPAGESVLDLEASLGWKGGPVHWRGFAIHGERVILEYSVGDLLVRESPWAIDVEGTTLLVRDFEFGPTAATEASITLVAGTVDQAIEGEFGRTPYFGYRKGPRLEAVTFDLQPGVRLLRPGLTALELGLIPRDRPLRLRVLGLAGDPNHLPKLGAALKTDGRPPNLAALVAEARGPASPAVPVRGQTSPSTDAYVIDTIPVPYQNPWNALMFGSGVGFFDNGDAAISTIHGDVWRVSGLDDRLERVEWRRIASGLFQPLGLAVVSNQVVVLCRDHLTRLQDFNGDGATDYYESVSHLIDTSANGHDYVTSLCVDKAGNFYYVDPLGAHRLSPDGRRKTTLARGFRNPNGMGVHPEGTLVTVAPQQGEWTPSSVIHELRPDGWYGYPGPRPAADRPLGYDPPLCWIPHRVDNSSGSQIWVASPRFGPLDGHLLHLSWGRCTMLLALRDVVEGTAQGAVVPLKGRFLSGPMRGAFSPRDGQLYVVGCQGWQTAAARDGSFQRVRWTGKKLPLPVAWQALPGALRLTFNEPLDPETARDPDSYALEAWNYRYAAQYGSRDWSVREPDREGRDPWDIQAAQLESDGRTVLLTVPDLRPVMQFGLKFNLDTADGRPAAGEMYGTIHQLHSPPPDN